MFMAFCHFEGEKNFFFCFHSRSKDHKAKIALSITLDKNDEGEQISLDVAFCPFCGFSYVNHEEMTKHLPNRD